jgi:hypothetical protein
MENELANKSAYVYPGFWNLTSSNCGHQCPPKETGKSD